MEETEKETGKEPERAETAQERTHAALSDICGYGTAVAENRREHFQCISVIGQVEGHYLLPDGQKATKYEHLIPLLVSIEEDDGIDGLLVMLNTMGGDVEAGLAIAEIIASMTKPSVSLVLGGSHSIGVPLAAAAKRSLIVPSATMTLHPVRVNGMIMRPDQMATDCGTILEAEEAVAYGIIDEVGGLDRALSILREMKAKRPENKNKISSLSKKGEKD